MIPLHKLNELPRTIRLRKSASLFGEAERRLVLFRQLPKEEKEYLGRIAELLAKDEKFPEVSLTALRAAHLALADGDKDDDEIRRVLNAIHYILRAETGRNQADWDFIESSGALDPSKRRSFSGLQVYLEDIRSPFNVGSMFRAAESFGVEKIWLSPLCADPRHKRASRTAMGCVDVIPWEYLFCDPFTAPADEDKSFPLPFSQNPVFALETGGTPLNDFPFPARGILIAGSEELGVSPGALAAADASLGRVSIPTWGAKGSLNVSVAFGIVMQVWADRLMLITVRQ